jgi:penicillin-binding protein 1A
VEFDPRPPARPQAARPRRERRLGRWIVPLAIAMALGAALGIGVAAAIHVPRVDSLADFTPSLITQLVDRNGRPLTSYARERRVMLQEGDVPPLLQNALVAAEDRTFFRHGGIDALGVARAAISNLRTGRMGQGASTLTMTLARMLYLKPEKTWKRKIEQTFVAVELEKNYSKQQILTLFCNLVFLGHGNYGMESAARSFFGKSVGELSVHEAATLAGIVQQPSRFSPYRNPTATVKRRDYVLRRMFEDGLIGRTQYEAALAQPLLVVPQRAKAEPGPYFAEEVRRWLEAKYGTEALYGQGLQVQTTLDLDIQRATDEGLRQGLLRLDHRKGWRGPLRRLEGDLEAQELPSWENWTGAPGAWAEGIVIAATGETATVKIAEQRFPLTRKGIAWTGKRRPQEILKPGDVAWFRLALPEDQAERARSEASAPDGEPYLQLEQEPQLQGAAIVLESATGAVRGLVGGWAFETTKFDRATQAHRQVGSAFKPFVYGAALEAGFTPADTLFDAPAVFMGADARLSYSPRNYYRKYYGIITLRRALEQSANVASVKLLDLIGVGRVIDFTHRAGIEDDLPPYPSLALGAADLVPMQVAAAYAAIANQGVHMEPYFVERVSSHDGRAIELHSPRARKAMEPAVAYVLTHMLEGVIDRGTAGSIADLDVDLAGKTGTTDDYSDAWFIGFTPRYTILTWVGYDQKRSIGRNMTGAEAALPAWRMIVQDGLERGWIVKGERFVAPPGVTFVAVEQLSGLRAVPGAERVIDEAFVEGTQPEKLWEPRWAGIMALPWFQQRAFYIPREGERMPEQITDWSLVQEAWEEKAKGN